MMDVLAIWLTGTVYLKAPLWPCPILPRCDRHGSLANQKLDKHVFSPLLVFNSKYIYSTISIGEIWANNICKV